MSLTISKGLCNVYVGKCHVCLFVCLFLYSFILHRTPPVETRNDYALSMKLAAIIVYRSWQESNTRADVFARCAKEKKCVIVSRNDSYLQPHLTSISSKILGRLTHAHTHRGPSHSSCLHSSSGEFQEWHTPASPTSFCNVKRYQSWTNIVNSSSS